ncbi:MAG: FtsW/RodA/SpoVE family cell cycle protein, partial [Gammaproteobacteria bacterium]|nr:FtsW/RodA/SpoVE family cell cycle protein [Gammaproteobacteria bacterium]
MTVAVASQSINKPRNAIWFDQILILLALALMAIGFVMVSSASMPYADSVTYANNPYHFIMRHGIYLCLALTAGLVTIAVPMEIWQKSGPYLLLFALAMLVLVLIIGREVNGSKRWLDLGIITIQVSEITKLAVVSYIAGYLVRRRQELITQIKGFLKPLVVLMLVTFALLLEPDFGASVVFLVTALSMMFLAGARLWQFVTLSAGLGIGLALLAVVQPYRWQRLQTFLDPWQDPFGTGYQLTQSLIAFGRGEFWGL